MDKLITLIIKKDYKKQILLIYTVSVFYAIINLTIVENLFEQWKTQLIFLIDFLQNVLV